MKCVDCGETVQWMPVGELVEEQAYMEAEQSRLINLAFLFGDDQRIWACYGCGAWGMFSLDHS